MTTTDRRYVLCLKSPLKSALPTSTRHNSKTLFAQIPNSKLAIPQSFQVQTACFPQIIRPKFCSDLSGAAIFLVGYSCNHAVAKPPYYIQAAIFLVIRHDLGALNQHLQRFSSDGFILLYSCNHAVAKPPYYIQHLIHIPYIYVRFAAHP